MSYYILQPLRWLERPNYRLRLRRDHPLAIGLKAFYDLRAGVWRFNQVSRRIGGTKVSSFGADFFDKWTRTFTAGEAGGNYLDLDTGGFDANGVPWTVITGALHSAGGVDWSLLRRDTDNWTGVYQQGTASFVLSNANDFAGSLGPTVVTKSPRGVVHCAVTLVGANNFRATAGGAIAVDTSVAVPTGGALTSCALGLSKRVSADNHAESFQEYWGIYNRALHDGEMQEICRAPWQMFEPDIPQVYVTVPSTANLNVTPGKADLTITGFAPSVSVTAHQSVSPGKADLTLTGFAPSVQTGASLNVSPGKADLTLTGFAPTVTATANQAVSPGKADLTLTGFAPTLDRGIIPGKADLVLTGFAPTVNQTATQSVTPGKADLILTGFAPTVTRTEHVVVNPATGALVITGYVPTVELGGDKNISPGAAALFLQAWAPTVLNSGDIIPPFTTGGSGGVRGRARTYRYLPERYEPEARIVKVLIEEDVQGVVQYKHVEWKPEASWQALNTAIEAILAELGNFDGSLARSTLLQKELKRLKRRRNQKIIMLAIE